MVLLKFLILKQKKPVDWNDEEDGVWDVPQIDNPQCIKIGCGVWKPREINNPNYKGKWVSPKIKNPKYIGVWAPKKVPNPNYFEDKNPHNFPKIGGLGLELWTMTKNVLFDNFLVTHDENSAVEYAKKTFDEKSKLEKFKQPPKPSPQSPTDSIFKQMLEFINQYPIAIFATIISVLISIPVLCCIGCRMSGSGKEKKVKDDSIDKSETSEKKEVEIKKVTENKIEETKVEEKVEKTKVEVKEKVEEKIVEETKVEEKKS